MAHDEGSENDSLLDLGSGRSDPLDELNERDQKMESLDAEGKKHLALEQVRRAVRQHGEDGISVTEIMELTGLARKTVQNKLERLTSLREIYRQKKGKQIYLYYPNGKPLHSVGSEFIECSDGETGIEVQLAHGKNEELYFHVTEKRFSLLEGETNEGAIIFPREDFEDLMRAFQSLNQEFEEINDN